MSTSIRLSRNELTELIEVTEAAGNDVTELRKLLAEVQQEKRLGKPANQISDEEHIQQLRSQSTVEEGEDLECMVCHQKSDWLLSGTCDICFREWALSTKKGE